LKIKEISPAKEFAKIKMEKECPNWEFEGKGMGTLLP
jgi:hypothetical protein